MKFRRYISFALLGILIVFGVTMLNRFLWPQYGEHSKEPLSEHRHSAVKVEHTSNPADLEGAVPSAAVEEESIFISGGLPMPGVDHIQYMELQLPDGNSMRVSFSDHEVTSSGAINWTGRIEGDPESFFSLSVVGDAVEGYTLSERGEFLLAGNPNGELELNEVKLPDGFCETCRAMHDPAAGYGDVYHELAVEEPAALAAGDPVVDVLVVYTPLALSDAGSLDALLAKANQMINSLNNIMSSSGADAAVNLIGIAPVSHPAAGATSDGSCSILWSRLRNASDGQLDEAHVYREAYGADMVCVFGKATGYGIASIGGAWSAADYSTAHGVMPHELGHNLGCGHNDVTGSGQTYLQGVYSYSFGHYFSYGGEQRGTLMSYIGRRSTTFSNPNNTWNGVVTGTATRDHARTIRTFAPTAAGWKISNPTDYDQDGIPNSEESASADADGDGLPDMLDPDTDVRVGFALSAPFYDQESNPGDDSNVWNSGTKIENITDGSWVRYGSVDFGFSGLASVDVSAGSNNDGSVLEVRLGAEDGILVSSVTITNTGGWNNFEIFSAPATVPVVGTHDVYLVFKGGANSLFDVESIFFNERPADPMVMEAEDAVIVSGTVKSDGNASGGQYVDGAGGFEVAWNVDASGGATPLDFRVKVPSGTRSMGVFVNGIKQGAISSSSSSWEAQSLFSITMNEGMNVVELRDSEGTTELDVDSLTHYLAGPELLQQWRYNDAGLLAYGWNGRFKLQACTNLTAAGWLDVPGGGNSPFIHSAGADPDPGKFFRLIDDPKPAIGKSYTWNGGAEAVATKHMTTSVYGGIISLTLDAANNDPYMRLNWGGTNGDTYHVVKMRVRNDSGGSAWRIYFKPQGGTEGGNSVPVTVPTNGEWEIVTVDMKNDPDFTGTIESIRLDQETLSAGTVDIDYVHLMTAP